MTAAELFQLRLVRPFCLNMLCLLFIALVIGSAQSELKLSTELVMMEVETVETFQLEVSVPNEGFTKNITFSYVNDDLVQVSPNSFIVDFNNTANSVIYNLQLKSFKAGKSGISITSVLSPSTNTTDETVFLIVEVYKSTTVQYLSDILGWSYFLAWSISFYPQIYSNYQRNSVVGLSFDFNWFNLYGYFIYNAFNMGMYYSPLVQEQFSLRNPRSINPVHLNDIVFSMHSLVATILIIGQCYYCERGDQEISTLATGIMGLYLFLTYFFVLLARSEVMLWLDVLYACSYIKLSVCVTKWFPQIYMNYQRQSTCGCSMGGIVLDFVGGILSVLQMVLDSLNYVDWACIVGNPTKLGLGVLSILFDIAFVFQHYVTWDHGLRIRAKTSKGEDAKTTANDINIENGVCMVTIDNGVPFQRADCSIRDVQHADVIRAAPNMCKTDSENIANGNICNEEIVSDSEVEENQEEGNVGSSNQDGSFNNNGDADQENSEEETEC